MELRREIQLAVAVLIGILLLVSLGSVLLFQRMAPAIERLLEENVYSLAAVEDMLAALGAGEDAAAFEDALDRAEQNITEENERPIIAAIRRGYPAALAGDPGARRQVVDALQALGRINREAAVAADSDAYRLGSAGAWGAVFLGLLGFSWGVLALRRFRVRVTEPVLELHEVLVAHARGQDLRRCRQSESVRELEEVQRYVNHLLDTRTSAPAEPPPELERGVLLHLLEQRPAPAFVLGAGGTIAAVNRAGLERLGGEEGAALRDQLRQVGAGDEVQGLVVEPIPDLQARIVEVRPPAGDS